MAFAVHPNNGGMLMNAQEYWKVFLDSGIPEYYVMYHQAKKMEEPNVFDDPGTGTSGMPLQ